MTPRRFTCRRAYSHPPK